MKRSRGNGRSNGKGPAKAHGRRKRRLRSPSEATAEMKRIQALRGRGKSLLDACKDVGVSVQTYYYRLNHAVYAGGRGGKTRGAGQSLARASAKKLVLSLDRFQVAVNRLRKAVESTLS